ncbi:MAG: hypothetical protein MUP45_01200 [Candidatus Marinimicrobia bacterium]|nr:hypothetical protein [Candidatus Neomarinimicrobiota bacterium]
MKTIKEAHIYMNQFGNKVFLQEGNISRFCTVAFETISPTGLHDPIGQLYCDFLLNFRQGGFRVRGSSDILIVADKKGEAISGLSSDHVHFVRDITRNRVTAGGWLARIDHKGRILPYGRLNLPLVRKAERGIKPAVYSENDFLQVNPELERRLVYVLEMGHPLFPVYRVFDPRGKLVPFYQHYPLSYAKWKEGEKP